VSRLFRYVCIPCDINIISGPFDIGDMRPVHLEIASEQCKPNTSMEFTLVQRSHETTRLRSVPCVQFADDGSSLADWSESTLLTDEDEDSKYVLSLLCVHCQVLPHGGMCKSW